MGPLLAAVGRHIGDALRGSVRLRSAQALSGGSISRAWRARDGHRSWFVKVNSADRADLFAAEADGLRSLARSPVRVPRVVCRGEAEGRSFLVLEWLELRAGADAEFAELGERLARQHALVGPSFGWERDNYIGSTPQANRADTSWVRFFGDARLAPQLALARTMGRSALCAKGEKLLDALPRLLAGHAPPPALLHGDLWAGNAAFLADGAPVIFDPAVYYGDPESDLAMTELFGGFPASFYAAYRAHSPPGAGYRVRRTLYQLYHVINHANLFGGTYAAQAEDMMDRLSAEV